MFAQRPQIFVCNVEFLSSKKVVKGLFLKQLGLLFQVRNVILDLSLSPGRQRPIVCIDESQVSFWQHKLLDKNGLQVLDSLLGWESFRKDYGASTWQWLAAATKPRSSQVKQKIMETLDSLQYTILKANTGFSWHLDL